MTKKERTEYERVVHELKVLAALRWTEFVGPDVPPPTHADPRRSLTKGFSMLGSRASGYEVVEACSSAMGHSFRRTDGTDSQRPIHLYSTRLRALQGMRYRVAEAAAEDLLKIDALIEAER